MDEAGAPSAGVTLAGDISVLRLEDAIARLPGVEAVRLVPGTHRPVEELHVIVSPDRRPDAAKREIQEMLLERFDVAVDWHVIRIVRRPEAATPPAAAPPPPAPARLVLETVHLAMRGHGTSVGVDLRDGEQRVHGAAGPVGPSGLSLAVAEATLDAVAQTVDKSLEPVSAEVVQVGGDHIALATVVANDGRSREQLTGSAMVRGNDADAIARAVLDATNRLRRDR